MTPLILALFLLTGEPTHLTLMLDWFPNADHVPLYVAQQKGFFREAGLDVEFQVPADPADPLKLAAAGKVDLAVNYQPEVLIARDGGLPVVSIGVLVEHPLTTILFLRSSGIREPKDLEGRTIGYAVPHLQEILFRAFARHVGLQRYELVHIGFNITPSLLTGKVDAVIGAYKNYEKNELELEGKEPGYFELSEGGIPDFYELVFITGEEKLREKRDPLRRFLEAVQRAIAWTRAYPEEALALYFQANPEVRKELDRKAFYDTLPLYAHTQVQSAEKWENLAEFFHTWGITQKKVDPRRAFINLVEERP